MEKYRDWLDKIRSLRVDRTHGDAAPHKPLLLLVILDMAEEGKLSPILPKNRELEYRFQTYSQIVSPRRSTSPRLVYPLYHLKSQGFWEPRDINVNPAEGYDDIENVSINPSFYEQLQSLFFRYKAREILITRYFIEDEYPSLMGLVNESYRKSFQHDFGLIEENEKFKQAQKAKFAIQVLSAYNFTCALTGEKEDIEATHIQPFTDDQYYIPQNGLALCSKAKHLFEKGAWSLTDEFRVIVNSNWDDSYKYAGKPIKVPQDDDYFPNKVFLNWHRNNLMR